MHRTMFMLVVASLLLTGCNGEGTASADAAALESHADAARDADAALRDHPVDEFGYAIVGDDVYPPLYQRVEAKCVPLSAGLSGECDADEDCGPGFACICGVGSLVNRCVPAECRTSADCNGGRCLLSLGSAPEDCCVNGHLGLVCSRSASTCRHGGDCLGNGIACIYDEQLDYFECKPNGCSCGG
jgi:hypothetical protein